MKCKKKIRLKEIKKKKKIWRNARKNQINEIQLQKEEMKIQEKRRVKRNTNAIENEIEHKQCRLSKEKEETDHIVILAVVII